MPPIIPIQKRLRIKPTFAISTCLTWPVANTIAFGGVAIGNIKAQLAPQAMMAARAIGGKFKVCATEITIGIINAALAVLEVNSVRKTMNALTTKTKHPQRLFIGKLHNGVCHDFTGTGVFHDNTQC